MKSYDVVIIGGGPSGSSLGYILEKAGISTCIIDRAAFPRKKLCGGLITEKTTKLINEIYKDEYKSFYDALTLREDIDNEALAHVREHECALNDDEEVDEGKDEEDNRYREYVAFPTERATKKINLYLNDNYHEDKEQSSVRTKSIFYLVDREKFDYHFILNYQKAGGHLYESCTVKKYGTNQLILSNGDVISFKVLAGADGANSEVRKKVDPVYRPNALCLEFNKYSTNIETSICVYFSAEPSGYAWCFPKSDLYTIGIGAPVNRNKNLKQSFMRFCKSIGQEDDPQKITGAMIPFGKYVKHPCKDNIILVGDAAGLVDPITGEGLYFAFRSSQLAARAIMKNIDTGCKLDEVYYKQIIELQKIIRNANLFKALLFNGFNRKYFLGRIGGKFHITRYFIKNILANYRMTYMDLVKNYSKNRRERHKRERWETK
ncbi:MAG TPA: hypothetical protein DFI01_08965 [Bacteroidales bacterium]|nr:hypothetical protein [Bacteroidales bacterium]